jgi:hypothetical protein
MFPKDEARSRWAIPLVPLRIGVKPFKVFNAFVNAMTGIPVSIKPFLITYPSIEN